MGRIADNSNSLWHANIKFVVLYFLVIINSSEMSPQRPVSSYQIVILVTHNKTEWQRQISADPRPATFSPLAGYRDEPWRALNDDMNYK